MHPFNGPVLEELLVLHIRVACHKNASFTIFVIASPTRKFFPVYYYTQLQKKVYTVNQTTEYLTFLVMSAIARSTLITEELESEGKEGLNVLRQMTHECMAW